ncbi:hypothetical protein [Nocardioides marmoribigeumensis]|uniref:AtpZ/AtpI family protein n=1 Tax=Nocardioides marmoribigeumensis TaxID=433649 RepID=A0ABU2BSG0_9ACTN|nr:hypothetical protein [Nocardioides marmoribigeumensis]MDR7360658.1 hypothetical protein [Nocardioides marmoribigeumensis]
MSEPQGTWAQWQAVAVSGLLVVVFLGAGAGAGLKLSDWLGVPGVFGWGVGLVAAYLLSRLMVSWVLARTVYRDEDK